MLNDATFDNAGTVGGTLQYDSTGTMFNSGTLDNGASNRAITAARFTTTGIVNPPGQRRWR